MDAFTMGMAFRTEIQSTQSVNRGLKWTWERYVDGPLSTSFVNTVCDTAGCWCYDNTSTSVKFYTNSNHNHWA